MSCFNVIPDLDGTAGARTQCAHRQVSDVASLKDAVTLTAETCSSSADKADDVIGMVLCLGLDGLARALRNAAPYRLG